MGKGGGAGKVYFVLYLAVVLELLIIIVERDEAEQGLLKKQKETMKIVESILSQLQSGAGTEGINTRPQDNITILDKASEAALGKDIKISSSRKYIIEVGVTDITGDILNRHESEPQIEFTDRLKKYVALGNVEDIEYQIFYNSNTDPLNAPTFPGEHEVKKAGYDFTKMQPGASITTADGSSSWEFLSDHMLNLDKDGTFNKIDLSKVTGNSFDPLYPKSLEIMNGPDYSPPGLSDSSFYYSAEETMKHQGKSGLGALKKRSFVVNFQPPAKAGWYKLRFASKTNKILGVRKDANPANLDENAPISIGTVTLTVKDLQKVKKELESKLSKYSLPPTELILTDPEKFDDLLMNSLKLASSDDNYNETRSKLTLYGYIAKLLAPGQSSNFDQNKGSIEFNIRVITPKPPLSNPTISGLDEPVYCFDKVAPVFNFTISPYQGKGINKVEGAIFDASGTKVASVSTRGYDEIANAASSAATSGGKMDFRGVVDKSLVPGKYKIKITHNLYTKNFEAETDLEIFPSKLTKESEADLKSKLSYASYGANIAFDAIPSSGGKIRPEQFRIYLTTDNAGNQGNAIQGLSASGSNKLFLGCKSNTVSLKVTWIQPFTNQEVDIFANQTNDIKQSSPRINPQDKQDQSASIGNNRVRVTVRGIKVIPTLDGSDATTNASVDVKVGKPQIDSRYTGILDIVSDPTIEKEENSYSVTFDMSVTIPRGADPSINAVVKVPIRAVAKNKCNGKESEVTDKPINVTVTYEQDKGGSRRGSSGGRRSK